MNECRCCERAPVGDGMYICDDCMKHYDPDKPGCPYREDEDERED